MTEKMKKIINILAVSFCFAIWVGCYKDKGNYDYTMPAEVEITAVDTAYITQFDTLSLPIDVDFGGLEEDEFEFTWRLWSDAIGNYERKTIGSSRDLQYEVNEVPGTYS